MCLVHNDDVTAPARAHSQTLAVLAKEDGGGERGKRKKMGNIIRQFCLISLTDSPALLNKDSNRKGMYVEIGVMSCKALMGRDWGAIGRGAAFKSAAGRKLAWVAAAAAHPARRAGECTIRWRLGAL